MTGVETIAVPRQEEPAGTIVLRGRVVTPEEVIDDGVVELRGGLIGYVGPAAGATTAGTIPAGRPVTILPGLVDVHCHGGGGEGFPDATTAEQAMTAVREHRRHGTTSLVASLVTAAPETLRTRVALLSGLAEAGELAGIHCEGPFLSTARCGAQDPALIQCPDADLTRELIELGRGHLVTMTVAPEAPGALDDGGVVDTLIDGGALPSYGHTDAGHGETARGIARACQRLAADPSARSTRPTITHLFNGMRPLAHREEGPVLDALSAASGGQVVVELIGDGVHLHPAVVREVFGMVGADGIVLVTDAMAAAGMADGAYRLGSMAVVVRDGVARLDDGNGNGGAIAGGTAHLIDVVRSTVAGGVGLVEAVRSASVTPARVLGRTDVGALRTGMRADVVVTDADLRVEQVYRGGTLVG
ncbi:amidohydrolase family protein [Brooklawnia cerclae]|uniref:N-acetylglucosamine-6-phosphate deacetylase n=1 Tax=Brooklawnia cerclae TaxID=349934 RepID=A0ABX0SKB8_9ACTN|nr:amidohydrolase family protein [Brooklawnia cerclae]NIH58864.1 N-acetylglucosamine-6-phosphate deacetylase [Brooklawnia cerclae]